jgi:hypothetical protein
MPVSVGIGGSPRQSQNYLETVRSPSGQLFVGVKVNVPTCIALFYVLCCISRNGMVCNQEYCGMELKADLFSSIICTPVPV